MKYDSALDPPGPMVDVTIRSIGRAEPKHIITLNGKDLTFEMQDP